MEANITGNSHHHLNFYDGPGKKPLEWDLNDWKWDGDLFTATPLNSLPSDCRSRQLFSPTSPSAPDYNTNFTPHDKPNRDLEKRRRVQDEDDSPAAASLHLNLGAQAYPIMDDDSKSGKKTKYMGNAPVCQVDDCSAHLRNAKDYHRRHKVCEMHSKATQALVGNVMQRFCQQCSRFHVLQEFDEGKRSCRRRLAGHNKRRRKTHPENLPNGGSLNDEKGSNYLLISLLRILSNLHSNNSNQDNDQDLLSHLLKNLARTAGTSSGGSISGLLQGSHDMGNGETSVGTLKNAPNLISNGFESSGPSASASKIGPHTGSEDIPRTLVQCGAASAADLAQKIPPGGTLQTSSGPQSLALFPASCNLPAKINQSEACNGRIKCNNIDLNNVYDGSQDCLENLEHSPASLIPGTESTSLPLWLQSVCHKKNPQLSGNLDSTSSESPSTSSEEAQSLTDRIVFKLFGKDPNDFPIAMRTQLLDWLSHSPSDIESYIRPGCIVLTIYLRLGKAQWEELCLDLGASLCKLLDASTDSFWKTGWIYARVQHFVSFIYNGQVVLDAPLPLKSDKNCRIMSIKPLAVPLSETTHFLVKGFNISQPTTRLLCTLEGKYLMQEASQDFEDGVDITNEPDKLQCLSFPCSIPSISGRGFIQVEDYGLSSSFFPFIVAEKDVCLDICTLEEAIEVSETADDVHSDAERTETKNQALDFVHELGWLLHRNRLKSRMGYLDPTFDPFPFKRFKWIMEFSMDHDWCSVVKKLLVTLFDGTVDTGEHASIELALLDMCLLHRAVQRNCRSMVELLLKYVPEKSYDTPGHDQKQEVGRGYNIIFKPDAVGPGGLTPLHVAASTEGSETVLDALTDDPGLVGIEAWGSARDNTGFTPNDYACLRGYYSYIHLIQRKMNKKCEDEHVVLEIPGSLRDSHTKQDIGKSSSKILGFELSKLRRKRMQGGCRLCEQRVGWGERRSTVMYRPAMLSMVAIAAVCVCVALLFKSSPEVVYVFRPFRWEMVKYGSS